MFSSFKSSSSFSESDSNATSIESAALYKSLSLFNELKNKLDTSRIIDLNTLFVDGVTSCEDSRYKDDSVKQFSASISSVIEAIIQEHDEEMKKYSGEYNFFLLPFKWNVP